jgi:hypothetical protein
MSREPSPPADLLEECDAKGIRLLLADDGGLTIDSSQDALTPDLLERLTAHKGELLKLLRQSSGFDIDSAPDAEPIPVAQDSATPACSCGGTTWRDVPIHHGQSIRRDCGRCGRFIDFPIWYGALQNEK